MNLLIESTDTLTTIDGLPVRLWSGTTDSGHPCEVYVARVGSADPWVQEALARQLSETAAPRERPLADVERDALRAQLERQASALDAARRLIEVFDAGMAGLGHRKPALEELRQALGLPAPEGA